MWEQCSPICINAFKMRLSKKHECASIWNNYILFNISALLFFLGLTSESCWNSSMFCLFAFQKLIMYDMPRNVLTERRISVVYPQKHQKKCDCNSWGGSVSHCDLRDLIMTESNPSFELINHLNLYRSRFSRVNPLADPAARALSHPVRFFMHPARFISIIPADTPRCQNSTNLPSRIRKKIYV